MLVCVNMGGVITTGSGELMCLVHVHVETGNVSASIEPGVTRIIPVEEGLGSDNISMNVRD